MVNKKSFNPFNPDPCPTHGLCTNMVCSLLMCSVQAFRCLCVEMPVFVPCFCVYQSLSKNFHTKFLL